MEKECQPPPIECQCCGKPATSKVFVCGQECANRLLDAIPTQGGEESLTISGRHGAHRHGGPRPFGRGHRHAYGHYRPYYARYYRGFRGNPLWRRYAWYGYYRGFPPYSPFWYLLSLYPPGHPFWDTFGYYAPDDPYWLQYERVSYGAGVSLGTPSTTLGCHVCGDGDDGQHYTALFAISSEAHGPDTWLISETAIVYRGRVLGRMSPSLWHALMNVTEHTDKQDWVERGSATDVKGRHYHMRLSREGVTRHYELVSCDSTEGQSLAERQYHYGASDMRALLNAVLGAAMRENVRDTVVLFNRASLDAGKESGSLVMASGRVYRYKVDTCDATLDDKLRVARRVRGLRLSLNTLEHLVHLSHHLETAPFTMASEPAGRSSMASTLYISYASESPVIVWAKGRLQIHYIEGEDTRLAKQFTHIYKKRV